MTAAALGAAERLARRAGSRTLLFGAGLLFGLSAVLAKVATRGPDGMTGAQATTVRFALGLAFILTIFRLRPGTFRPRRGWLLAARGFFGGVAALLYFVAISRISPGEATLLNNTFPIWAVIISFFILRERPTVHLAIALVIASSGAYLVMGGGHARFELGVGQAVAVVSAIFGGAAVTAIRALRATDTNAATIFVVFALGGLAVSLPFVGGGWPSAPLPWIAAVGMGVVAFGAQMLMTQAYGDLSVPEAALWQQLNPIASYAWSLTIGEQITGWTIVGVLLGAAGVVYGSVLGHRPAPEESAAEREAAAGIPREEP